MEYQFEIYLVYGACFFGLGLIALLNPSINEEQPVFRNFHLLGAFGLIHGVREFIDAWKIATGIDDPELNGFAAFLLISSFYPLLEFGRRSVLYVYAAQADVNLPSSKWFYTIIATLAAVLIYASSGSLVGVEASGRFLLALPGSILTGIALLGAFPNERLATYALSISFLSYAVFGGLIADPVPGFPSWLPTTQSFLGEFGVPVQLGRACCAAVAMISLTFLLRREAEKAAQDLRDASMSYQDLARKFEQRVVERTSELEQSERRLKSASEIAKLGYYVWDIETDRCTYCSEEYAAIHGMTVEEYLSQSSSSEEDKLFTHPEDRERYEAAFPDIFEDSNPVSLEYRIVGRDGRTRYVREIELPVDFEKGPPTKIEGVLQDITAFVEMEQKLHQAQKMEAIGNLTGGVAHDFNNLLAVILGNLELVKQEESEEQKAILTEAAIEATLKGAELTRNMLSFARRAPLQPTSLNLNETVSKLKEWAGRTLPENIEVETDLSSDLWTVEVDASSAESALLNLLLNARDAMPDGGKLTIKTSNVCFDQNSSEKLGVDLEPNHYVVLTVKDTGLGLPEGHKNEIFEPFYTTKPVGSGSGLGLSMVQGFMDQSGGAVSANSEIGLGTTFNLYFKANGGEERVVSSESRDVSGSSLSGSRVLVVEDEIGVLKVLTEMLSKSGYEVTSALSGDEALEVFSEDPSFEVLLTDIVMPGELQGTHLAKRLREIQPNLPVVFMSGYSSEITSQANGLPAEDLQLTKPVKRIDLLLALEKAISISR